jgi:hypothetical protein
LRAEPLSCFPLRIARAGSVGHSWWGTNRSAWYYDYDKHEFEDGSNSQIIFQLTKVRQAISDLADIANDLRTHLESIDSEVQAIENNTHKETIDYDDP